MLGATHKGLGAGLLGLLTGDGKINPCAGNTLFGVHLKHRSVGKLLGEPVAQHHMEVRSRGRGKRAGGRRKEYKK